MGTVVSKLFNTRLDRASLLICLFLITSTLTVYWPLKNQEFIFFDDDRYVTKNHYVQDGLTIEGIAWAFTDHSQDGYWIPLTWLSLMLDSQLHAQDAGGYKITNLLFHLANILLLFMILKRMTGDIWPSAFVAALFALHPLHVESVAWVTERKDVLSTLFWMLTMWAYLRYVERPCPRRYLLIVLFLAFGLMAKPLVVTLPFVLLLMDYWPLNRLQVPGLVADRSMPKRPPQDCRKEVSLLNLLIEKLPLFFLVVAASLVTIWAQHGVGSVAELKVLPIDVRLANSLVSYVIYIWKMIWPRFLGVLYPYTPLPPWHVSGAALFLATVTILVLRVHRRHPYLLVGWFWYLGTLVPMIGLIQVGLAARADRFTYVPSIGLFIMMAWGIPHRVSDWRHRKTILSLTAGLCLAAAAVVSRMQVHLWKNSATLFEHTLNNTENNFLIHYNLGRFWAAHGVTGKALVHFSESIRLNPSYTPTHNDLGIALAQQGKTREAEYHFSEVIRLDSGDTDAYVNLALVLRDEGRLDEAIYHFSKALELRPNDAETLDNLGILLGQQGKIDAAIEHFAKALQLHPDYAEAHNNLGIALSIQGKTSQADYHFSEAIRLNPEFAAEIQQNRQQAE